MKRLICLFRRHNWRLVCYMGWHFNECARCGKVRRLAGDIAALPKQRIRW